MIPIFIFICFLAITSACFGALIALIVEEERQNQIDINNAKNDEVKNIITGLHTDRQKENKRGLALSFFGFILMLVSLLIYINDYEKAILEDYVNGNYETETVVKTTTRGNNVQADTTLYFHKIKK